MPKIVKQKVFERKYNNPAYAIILEPFYIGKRR